MRTTLRPGLLVALKTKVRGNLFRETYDKTAQSENGKQWTHWKTRETIADVAEYEAAIQIRSKIRSLIRGVCAVTAFGFLCPVKSGSDLETAIVGARQLATQFNANAKFSTRIEVNVLIGEISADDVEAVKAINSEVRDLLAQMTNGIRNVNAEAVRDAANKARALGQMLEPQAQGRIQEAIEVARDAARQITKAGDQAAAEINEAAISRIDTMRTAFLDIPSDGEPAAEIAAPAIGARALDLEPRELEPRELELRDEPEPTSDPAPIIG
jgi:hypothetical protein